MDFPSDILCVPVIAAHQFLTILSTRVPYTESSRWSSRGVGRIGRYVPCIPFEHPFRGPVRLPCVVVVAALPGSPWHPGFHPDSLYILFISPFVNTPTPCLQSKTSPFDSWGSVTQVIPHPSCFLGFTGGSCLFWCAWLAISADTLSHGNAAHSHQCNFYAGVYGIWKVKVMTIDSWWRPAYKQVGADG